jgi:transcriptional antiterminator RfaH
MVEWFCVHCRPQQETRAAIELTKQDFRAYMPLIDSKAMFPRYIFVQFDKDADNWGVIRSTRGCIDLLKNGFSPIPIRQSIMDAIMAYEPPAEPVQPDQTFTKDQKVRITTGILAGYEGLFEGTDKQRVYALLTIVGKKVSVPMKDISSAA